MCLYTEVARSIEDPYSWIKPCHDLTGVGWRLYSESLQLHEASVADVDAAAGHAADADRHYRAAAAAAEAAAAVAAPTSYADVDCSTVDVDAPGSPGMNNGPDSTVHDAGSKTTRSVVSAAATAGATTENVIPVRQSVAHGAVDVILLSSQQPSAEAVTAAAVKRAAAAAAAAAKASKLIDESSAVSPDATRVRIDIGALTAANHRTVGASSLTPQSSSLNVSSVSTLFATDG